MSSFAHASATVPEPCKVLGTNLRPFCLGHHLLFKRLNISLADNPMAVTSDEDFLIAVAICAEAYEKTLAQFLEGTWEEILRHWKKQLHDAFLKRGVKKLAQVPNAFRLFRAYLQDGYQKPPVWQYNKDGITLSAPWELLLKNRLVMAGYSEADVLNGYLPARWYDYFTVGELNAAANCMDAKRWKKVFYTAEDSMLLARAKGGA